MRSWIFVSLTFLFILSAAKQVDEDDVITITKDNIEENFKTYPFILIEFYSPNCFHCQELAPEYAKAAKVLKESQNEQGQFIALGKVNAVEEKELSSRYEIQGYPTIIFFVDNGAQQFEYDGERTSEAIVEWIFTKSGPPAKLLQTEEEVNNWIAEASANIGVIYFAESAEEQGLKEFETFARQNMEVLFAYTLIQEVRGTTQFNGKKIVMLKNFLDTTVAYEGEINSLKLQTWLNKHAFPAVMPMNERTIQLIFHQGEPGLFLFYSPKLHGETLELFKSVALKAVHYGVRFVYLDDEVETYKELAEFITIDTNNLPQLAILHPSDEDFAKFKFDGQITAENIEEFVKAFTEDRLEPHLRSQEPEESEEVDEVKVVVGRTFKQIVLDNPNDVLVEFYAPWCGHCQALAPIYARLAEQLSLQHPNLVVAKIDASVNDVASMKIQHYPSIFFFKNGEKDTPIEFEAANTFNNLAKFVQQHTTYDWAGIELESEEEVSEEEQSDGDQNNDDDEAEHNKETDL